MKTRLKTKPIPVRLPQPTCDRLDAAAGKLCSTRAGIMRLAITQILPDLEAGRLVIKVS
jgi:predicted DNA-binding protein